MIRKRSLVVLGSLLGALVAGCSEDYETNGTAKPVGNMGSVALKATLADTRFYVADNMLAAIEMQVSGEPFAELLPRDIAGYDRFSADSNIYVDPETGEAQTDTLGWALAIESYEYSKQVMNNTSFESGAGLSLQYGPFLNPEGKEGDEAYQLLYDRIQYLGLASRASGAVFGKDFVTSPPDQVNYKNNHYGWPAIWPVFAEFRSFDPTIPATFGTTAGCDLGGATDEPIPPELLPPPVGDYECDYNSLNLPDRDSQVEKVIEPDALGYAAWKQSLWAINYWATMHDIGQNPIELVSEDKLSQVGEPGNTVIGQFQGPVEGELVFGKTGTYLGGVSLEGFQGLMMLDELYNKTVFVMDTLMTTDGSTLSGFATPSDAFNYDYNSPLRWWPASVAVTEQSMASNASDALKYFPKPTAFDITSGESRLQDYSGMLAGFGALYAMTDPGNAELGGSLQFRATWDGSPWPADDPAVLGEDSPHDRALGILKIALVNLDRVHFDESYQVLTNSASPGSGAKGTTVDTYSTAQVIVSLRAALRALNSSLSLYGNDTPDQLGAPNPLDASSLAGAPFSGTVESRMVALVRAEATFIISKLIGSDGLAVNGFDLSTGQADTSATTLASQAAVIRALLEAYLVTSDEQYRQASLAAFEALESQFWMEDVRAYRTTLGDDNHMEYTPKNFGILNGALRQYWKLVAIQPGFEAQAGELLSHVERTFKLVANGWDDKNRDSLVDAGECLGASLQLGERALTGELSRVQDAGDRDHDCVPDIATAGLPSALGGMFTLDRK